MRNDNNVTVVVKTERVSSVAIHNASRDSLKENSIPVSGIKMSVMRDNDDRRSASVEIINTKPVEIDITKDEANIMMPPPELPPKQNHKGRTQKPPADLPIDPTQPLPIRVTRSKVKKEKQSIEKATSETFVSKNANAASVRKSNSENILPQSKADEITSEVANKTNNKKNDKKKYPMPILIKLELDDETASTKKKEVNISKEPSMNQAVGTPNQTFDVPVNETVTISTAASINNETITLATNQNVNETVVLEKNDRHDSLMTEDNDEDEAEVSMNVPLSQLQKAPTLPSLKLKKNEVFK
jgi:hypothetical protein